MFTSKAVHPISRQCRTVLNPSLKTLTLPAAPPRNASVCKPARLPDLAPAVKKSAISRDFSVPAPVYPHPALAFKNTPLVGLPDDHNRFGVYLHAKLETGPNNNSFKERVMTGMVERALASGEIRPGETLVEATAGNTGIALARAITMWNKRHTDSKPLKCVVVMPENFPGRAPLIRAFGAQVILTPAAAGMEEARRIAQQMQAQGAGKMLDQFNNPNNWRVHFEVTAPELAGQLLQLPGRIDTIVLPAGSGGLSRGIVLGLRELARSNDALAKKLAHTRIHVVIPEPGHLIPGIRRWSDADKPRNYDLSIAHQVCSVTESQAKHGSQEFAAHGLLVGPSGGAGLTVGSERADELIKERQRGAGSTRRTAGAGRSEPAHIVVIASDSGVPYIETGLYDK